MFNVVTGVVFGHAVLVDPEKFREGFGYAGEVNHFKQITMKQPFSDDGGKAKSYTLTLEVGPFQESIAIFRAVLHGQGYKKYGLKWAKQVEAMVNGMLAGPGVRYFIEPRRLSVLTHFSKECEPKYTRILYLNQADVEPLFTHRPSPVLRPDEKVEYIRYNGYVFCDALYEEEETIDGVIERAMGKELVLIGQEGRIFVDVDGKLFRYFSPTEDFRFGFTSTDFGACGHLNIMRKYSTDTAPINQSYMQLRTIEEVRHAAKGKKNESELLEELVFVHSDLVGEPVPDFMAGQEVVVSELDPGDPRLPLVGQRGVITSVKKYDVTVQFLGFFEQEFMRSEVKAAQPALETVPKLIQTPGGIISVTPASDPHYPGVYVDINESNAALVEWHGDDQTFKIHAWCKKEEMCDPIHSYFWESGEANE